MRLRRGAVVRAHFAHEVNPNYCDFLHETEEHLRAKWALAAAMQGQRTLEFRRKCTQCGGSGVQPLPPTIKQAQLEYVLPSGHRADVALFDDRGELRAVIEVFCTHAVDESKKQALNGIRWAEVEAKDVLLGGDIPLLVDHFAPYTCGRCRLVQRFGGSYKLTGQHLQEVECPIPGRGLVNVIESCARCRHFVTVKDQAISCAGRIEARGAS